MSGDALSRPDFHTHNSSSSLPFTWTINRYISLYITEAIAICHYKQLVDLTPSKCNLNPINFWDFQNFTNGCHSFPNSNSRVETKKPHTIVQVLYLCHLKFTSLWEYSNDTSYEQVYK